MSINVLSLFDGMSCGQIAFDKLGVRFEGEENKYFASEIKKIGIKVTKHNYPNTIHIGDVTKVSYKDGVLYTENGNYNVKIDVLIGGSPCQDFSLLKTDGKGLKGDKSKLFYEYLRILKEVKPKYFLLENVKMKKGSYEQLNEYLGVVGVCINSRLVSYQNRPRYYWSNIPNITIPEDRNINFQDYKEKDNEICKKYMLNPTSSRIKMWNNGEGCTRLGTCHNITHSDKVFCLTRKQDRSPNSGLIECEGFARFLTREELEMAQTVPLGYTSVVTYNQAQDLLGDGWTVDVISHILKNIID